MYKCLIPGGRFRVIVKSGLVHAEPDRRRESHRHCESQRTGSDSRNMNQLPAANLKVFYLIKRSLRVACQPDEEEAWRK